MTHTFGDPWDSNLFYCSDPPGTGIQNSLVYTADWSGFNTAQLPDQWYSAFRAEWDWLRVPVQIWTQPILGHPGICLLPGRWSLGDSFRPAVLWHPAMASAWKTAKCPAAALASLVVSSKAVTSFSPWRRVQAIWIKRWDNCRGKELPWVYKVQAVQHNPLDLLGTRHILCCLSFTQTGGNCPQEHKMCDIPAVLSLNFSALFYFTAVAISSFLARCNLVLRYNCDIKIINVVLYRWK